jgi:O-antigen/teichoic acid export membrane protein
MVSAAWAWHSIWALLIGGVVAGSVRCVLGYRLLPGHTAKFRIDRDASRELLGHAKWIMLSSISGFLAVNGDRVLLGGLITSREFGLYSIAIIIATILQTIANSLCNSIVFPALSEVHRDRPHELPRSFERFQWGYDAMIVFPAAILIAAGPTLIDLMYDARYHEAGWMLAVLSAGVIGVRYQVVEVGYLAVGKTKYGAAANVLRLAALLSGLLIGSHFWGLTGAIVGVAASQYAAWPLAIWFKGRIHALTWRAEALFLPALVGGLLAGTAISAVSRLLLPRHFNL